jgi:tetratricopeptide (TPR) repeat protein
MLVAMLEIPYFDQLSRVDPVGAQAVRGTMDRTLSGLLEPFSERRGRFLFQVPGEPTAALRGALHRIVALKRALEAADAGDHICLVFEVGDKDPQAVDKVAERMLYRMDASAPVGPPSWRRSVMVHADAGPALPNGVALSGDGEFLQLGAMPGESPPGGAPTPEHHADVAPVLRPNVSNRIVDAAFTCLQEDGPRHPVLVLGPDGVGKSRSVLDAARTIVGTTAWRQTVLVHPVYNRKSAIHPFLNSIRDDMLELVPRYLRAWERPVWASNEALIRALLTGVEGEPNPPAKAPASTSICPDRIVSDFTSAYRLYLLAHARRMGERGAPAMVVFEDLHAYHPEALQLCVSLVRDLLALPGFLPILTCRAGHDASTLFGTQIIGVPVHAVSLEEIRGAARILFPEVRLPEKAARRIRRLTEGQLLPIQHCLRHLERSGKMQKAEQGYTWVTGTAARIPSTPLAAAWEEIECLPRRTQELLYLCALASGILAGREVVQLAATVEGEPPEGGADAGGAPWTAPPEWAGLLDHLESAGLVRSADEPVFLHPRLKGRLAEALGDWAHRARARLEERLEASWRAGEARRLVLIYSLLRTTRPEAAMDILVELVTQKLDELNVRGCHFFLDPAKLGASETPPGFDLDRFKRLAVLGSLRSHLLLGAWKRAEEAMDDVTNLDVPDASPRELGHRALEQARFYLVKGDAPAAAKAAKTGVIQYHEAGDERGERRAETELGAALLAGGRLEEAGEYFGFVARSPACDAFPRVRASALAAVSRYLLGYFTASVRLADEAIEVAAAAGRREWQAFMLFLRARQQFDVGQFDEAILGLERLLCFARVYGMQRASGVAAAWMGRCLCHAGRASQAAGLWARVGESSEARFFRAEGLFLQGQVGPALDLLAPVDVGRRRPVMDPGERVSWESGFASVEERCVALRRSGGTVLRLLRAFRAYLTGLDGRPEQAMRELYRITREERVSDLDPYLPLYNYWYAATLPEEGGEGTDHKLTILNRAMKHLQQRSSRIENARDRFHLMTSNYWNARLLEEGKARHLV